MDLLFNKADNGNQEVKELLGFTDADLKYLDLESEIISATNEVIALIEQTTYDTAVTAYAVAAPSATQLALIHAVRYPILVQAYRQLIPSYDLRHTTSGRKNAGETHEKAPFEWQLDRDNKAHERRYYRALDDMIHYLDAKSTVWKATDTYKATFNLFIRTTKQFDDNFPIGNSRLLLLKLAPGIKKAQRRDIKPRIGQELHDNMIKDLRGETPTGFTLDKELLDRIREALVYKAMAWAIPRYSLQLFPEGTLQAYTSDRMSTKGQKPPEKSETPATAQLFNQDAQEVYTEIEEMITILNAPEPIDPDSIEPLTPYAEEEDKYLDT